MSPLQMRGYSESIPLEELPPIARRTIEAAIRILARDGFRGLTYEAIGAESGEYKDTIRYYFGGKEGLIEAVFDALWHDRSLEVYAASRQISPGKARVEATVYASREVVDESAYDVMWEILPHVLRNAKTRQRVADLYDLYRAHYLEVLEASSDPEASQKAWDYASMLLAMMDGLALQRALDPERVDLDRLYSRWAKLIADATTDCMHPGASDAESADSGIFPGEDE